MNTKTRYWLCSFVGLASLLLSGVQDPERNRSSIEKQDACAI